MLTAQSFGVCAPKRCSSCASSLRPAAFSRPQKLAVRATPTKKSEPVQNEPEAHKSEAQSTTEKYGLEAGLFKVLTNKEESSKEGGKSKTAQAKDLLAQYGSAYLITSISFAIVSYALCYAAVSSGVDVAALLAKVGLQATDTSEKVGTAAIAYAAHKALSPVRFPPTVALTPIVAKWTGRKKEGEQNSST